MTINTAFITGASGFIGGHLVQELTRRQVKLKCLVRPTSDVSRLQADNIELVRGTIEEPECYREAVWGCDTVLHCAGLTHAWHRDLLFRTNGDACGLLADVCAAADNPPRLVQLSSLAAAGPAPPRKEKRVEGDPSAPVSHYGHSKKRGEIELRKRAADGPITVIQPGVVYGPRDRAFAGIVKPIYRMGLHIVVGFRTPPLSLIFVDDLVRLILAAAERGETLAPDSADGSSSQGVYLACDDTEHPNYWQLGQRIARALGRRVFVWPLWRWFASCCTLTVQGTLRLRRRSSFLNMDKIREASQRTWACDTAKARRQLGFVPTQPLDERLKETTAWLVREGWI